MWYCIKASSTLNQNPFKCFACIYCISNKTATPTTAHTDIKMHPHVCLNNTPSITCNIISIITISVARKIGYNILVSLDIIPLYSIANPVIPLSHIYTGLKKIRQYPSKGTAVSCSYLPRHRDKYG